MSDKNAISMRYVSGLLTRPAASRYSTEVDVTFSVPDVEVDVEPRRRTAETYLNAANILVRIEFKVAYVRSVYAPDKLIVLLLLFPDSFR
jgi:hypothetical protein